MNERDSLFQDICELSPDLIQSVDADGRFLYVNPAWRSALGYEPGDVGALRFLELVHADDRQRAAGLVERVFDGETVELRTRFLTRAGESLLVEGNTVRHTRDGATSACGILRDVTAVGDARAQLDRLFTLSLDLLCIASGDGFFKRINPAFERTLGYSREELLSRSFLEFVHPDDQDKTLAALEQLIGGQPVVDFRNRYRAADGSYRWLQWRSAPVDESGLVYAVARDVTEELRAQKLIEAQARDLARSNEDLQEFAYAASHDLQAPLRAIHNLVRFIGEDWGDDVPAPVAENFERLDTRVREMQGLIDDLLAYARAGQTAEAPEEVDLAALVARMPALLAVPEGFQVRYEGPDAALFTSATPLEQVLRNLIGNALKHHDRETGEIVVSARQAGNMWEISVADDGPGIPDKDRDRVFQMFHRLRATEAGGTGLGLALVKKIVQRYGGRVWVVPGAGRGANLRFTWPVTSPDPVSEAE